MQYVITAIRGGDAHVATLNYDQFLYLVECYNTLVKRDEMPDGLSEVPDGMSVVIDDINAELAA